MAAQLTIFDAQQPIELVRVTGHIANAILRFLRLRLNAGGEFHADELREWVAASVTAAPGSADRILRELRKDGRIAYRLVDRSKSLYRILVIQ